MGFVTLDRMKDALLAEPVSDLERIVLLDMAVAVDDDTVIYTWGHERLARALGRQPGLKATKSALERVLSRLTARGLLVRTGEAHRGRHAEYTLAVLDLEGPRSERGPFFADPAEKGPRSGEERAPVQGRKGPGLSGAPLPVSLPVSLPGKRTSAEARNRPMSNGQASLLEDLRRMLGYDDAPALRTWGDADDLIREYWQEVERRKHNEEPFDGRTADLSPLGQRYARSRELWFPEDDHGQWATYRKETA